MGAPHGPAEERFWRHVVAADSGCWLWTGATTTGYGSFNEGGHHSVLAHLWSYEQFIGPMPEGKQADHLCRTPPCVNPTHLEAVTSRENTLRGNHPSAITHRTGRCKRGHSFPVGKRRQCRICLTERQREVRAERRAASRF